MNTTKQTKSKQRVRDFGEVYTAEREVKAMCDLLPLEMFEIDKTFLEPACGNGAFLAEILSRKLERCKDERDGLKALNSIFGIDILPDNVDESRERLLKMYLDRFPCASSLSVALATTILSNRIVCDNALNPQTKQVKSWGLTPDENYQKIKARLKQNDGGQNS